MSIMSKAEWRRRKDRKTPAQEQAIRERLGMGLPTVGPKRMRKDD